LREPKEIKTLRQKQTIKRVIGSVFYDILAPAVTLTIPHYEEIFSQMRDIDNGIHLVTRLERFKAYKDCTTGEALVDWILVRGLAKTYNAAIRTLQALLDFGYIKRITAINDDEREHKKYMFKGKRHIVYQLQQEHGDWSAFL